MPIVTPIFTTELIDAIGVKYVTTVERQVGRSQEDEELNVPIKNDQSLDAARLMVTPH